MDSATSRKSKPSSSTTADKRKPSPDRTRKGGITKVINSHPMPTRISIRVATAISLNDRFTRAGQMRPAESHRRPTTQCSLPYEDQQRSSSSVSQAYDQLPWPQNTPYLKPAEQNTGRRLSERIGRKNVKDRLGTRRPLRAIRPRPYQNRNMLSVNDDYIPDGDVYYQSGVPMNDDFIGEMNVVRGFKNRNRYRKYPVRDAKKREPSAANVRKTREQLNLDLEQYMSLSHSGRVMDVDLDEYLRDRT